LQPVHGASAIWGISCIADVDSVLFEELSFHTKGALLDERFLKYGEYDTNVC
jgi:hypothetical protein